MNEPTLYRVVGGMLLNNDFEGRKVWITPGGERTYATLGRMVPVEPDYEAAAMLLFERLGYVGTPNPELFSDVKDAVDTALGEPV